VTLYDGKEWRLFATEDGLGKGGISTIFEDKDGNVWFDSSAMTSLMHHLSFIQYPPTSR
jgi:hypothetical protein